MKKKLALLLVAAMAVSAVPATSFAATSNRVSNVSTVADEDPISTTLTFEDKDDTDVTETFSATLVNAEWDYTKYTKLPEAGISADSTAAGIYYTKVTDKEAIFYVKTAAAVGSRDIKLPINATAKEEGDAQIIIDAMDSNLTGGTYTIAVVGDSGTKATIEKAVDVNEEGKEEIKPIVITEITPGSLKAGETIKLKLGGDFVFNKNSDVEITRATGDKILVDADDIKVNDDEITIKLTGDKSDSAVRLVIEGIEISSDDAEAGDEAEITISGAGVTKQTLVVGKYVDYGYTWKVEKGDVPVIYSGRENGDTDLLKVTFKETTANSANVNRTATITLPEGVKFVDVDPDPESGSTITSEGYNSKDKSVYEFKMGTNSKQTEIEFDFEVEVAPDFTGDVVATFGGAAVGNEETTAVIATVAAPITVKAEKSDVSIDYRNVAVSDITITEAYAGALPSNSYFTLEAEKMTFESGMEWEVTEGDIKIEKIEKTGGNIKVKVKSSSSKTPSTIKISNLSVYLDRTLPVGDYKLSLVATSELEKDDVLFTTYKDDAKAKDAHFDVDSVTVLKDYITVITAGRDQDDSTFTTKITVTVGESTLIAGDKVIELDAPAFINADSRAMLPVRAVIEALSGTVAIKWDDATKTAFFSMGSRVFSMTVGSRIMTISGTPVAMTTAPVIVNERIFIPLRDLGTALGLNDDKISWDDATKTAVLN